MPRLSEAWWQKINPRQLNTRTTKPRIAGPCCICINSIRARQHCLSHRSLYIVHGSVVKGSIIERVICSGHSPISVLRGAHTTLLNFGG